MRSIKITNCSYDAYNEIRDYYMEHLPWAIANDSYSRNKKIAVFLFNDSAFIVPELKKYQKDPPNEEELKKKISANLKNWKPDLEL